ncbi:hypothetical protein PGT21_031679 [Puccinia graminis f. sp. tritici]|uniref:Uncharacterized protein n=1 Tax=Puccinia graminis f. sp. tritici TaxID=56615 RepID=A0A5B0QBW0_PUCGR|nr:hypothetical protein PGT21_031679 [Puccinia graminis f. sp. tritici]
MIVCGVNVLGEHERSSLIAVLFLFNQLDSVGSTWREDMLSSSHNRTGIFSTLIDWIRLFYNQSFFEGHHPFGISFLFILLWSTTITFPFCHQARRIISEVSEFFQERQAPLKKNVHVVKG